MDDYILEILRIQEQPEEKQQLKLRIEELTSRRESGQQAAAQELEMEQNTATAAVKWEEKSTEPGPQNPRSAGETAQWLLRQMEPVQTVPGADGLRGKEQTEHSAFGLSGTAPAAFGSAPGRTGEAGISPEALSMFFQRDARRYP